jgi:hypothetical protein
VAEPVLPPEIAAISFEVADRLEPEMRAAFFAIVEVLRRAIPLDELRQMLEAGAFDAILARYQAVIGSAAVITAADKFVDVHRNIFQASLKTAIAASVVNAVFSGVTTTALKILETNSGELITGVSSDTLDSVRRVLASNHIQGLGAIAGARLVRSVIFLLPRHADAVVRYAEGLRLQGVSEQRVGQLADLYASRLLNLRASTITRTEVIRASMSAQVAYWQQLQEEGIIDRDRTWMEWVVTEDDRLCPWCAPMDGKRVRIGEAFLSTHRGFPDGKPTAESTLPAQKDTLRPDPRGPTRNVLGQFAISKALTEPLEALDSSKYVLHPPLHPNGRCTLRLRFDSSRSAT